MDYVEAYAKLCGEFETFRLGALILLAACVLGHFIAFRESERVSDRKRQRSYVLCVAFIMCYFAWCNGTGKRHQEIHILIG